jgi:SnoaL-like domain
VDDGRGAGCRTAGVPIEVLSVGEAGELEAPHGDFEALYGVELDPAARPRNRSYAREVGATLGDRDESELRHLVERYFGAIDSCDWELLASCFSEDAIGEYMDGEWMLHGRSELVRGISETISKFHSTLHLTGSTVCTVDGEGIAGTIFATANVQPQRDGGVIVRGLRYDDRYELHGGRWLIVKRRHRVLWNRELGEEAEGVQVLSDP